MVPVPALGCVGELGTGKEPPDCAEQCQEHGEPCGNTERSRSVRLPPSAELDGSAENVLPNLLLDLFILFPGDFLVLPIVSAFGFSGFYFRDRPKSAEKGNCDL